MHLSQEHLDCVKKKAWAVLLDRVLHLYSVDSTKSKVDMRHQIGGCVCVCVESQN